MDDTNGSAVDNNLYIDIQRFLFREAALLDRRDYAGWFSLLTDDVRYCVKAMVSRDAGSNPVDYAIVDENSVALKSRIDQISNPKLTRAENPPSFTRRVVSNVEAYHNQGSADVRVLSSLLAYRNRPNVPEGSFYVAQREDIVRKVGSGWKLASRCVRLDQTMIFDGALSTLL
jgi:3-phenylpropionate/cinnamic acid dioxygenase small subunit